MEKWYELKVFVAAAGKDAVSSRLFEIGAQGVVEDIGFVSGFFPESAKAEMQDEWPAYVDSLMEMNSALAIRWEWKEVEDVDWTEKYKETFKAQKLTNLFYLQPAWDKTGKVPAGMLPIRMELGQAFGTGLHSSTRLALHLVQSIAAKFWDPNSISLLDVGTGTGILAIAAEKLGMGDIFANDIDEVSVEVAKENLVANECSLIALSTRPIDEISKQYDIVVANILLETHKHLQPHYSRLCKPHGYLILSGFLSYQLRDYYRFINKSEWKLLEEYHLQDWGACLFGRRS
jgi:ribosomal protein L11 methyltransferase